MKTNSFFNPFEIHLRSTYSRTCTLYALSWIGCIVSHRLYTFRFKDCTIFSWRFFAFNDFQFLCTTFFLLSACLPTVMFFQQKISEKRNSWKRKISIQNYVYTKSTPPTSTMPTSFGRLIDDVMCDAFAKREHTWIEMQRFHSNTVNIFQSHTFIST